MSRISVVVPVYNVADCLDACMESLRAQTLEDIEIICVNDGSTDDSRSVLDAWAARDSRICVVDKQNGGLSSARNAGIRAARSPYVCFLDSDDRFHARACEEMVRILENTGADVLTFGSTWTPEDEGYPWLEWALSPRDAEFDAFDPDLLFKEASRPFAWRTACRTGFLLGNDLFFDETVKFGEDQVWHFAIYPRSKKTVLSSAKLYEYRLARPGSLMSTVRDDFFIKMSEHVKILDAIFLDWERGGFLDRWPAEMVAFALDFALYDALKLSDGEYQEVARGVEALLRRYWTATYVAGLPLAPVTQKMAQRACYRQDLSRPARLKLALDYFAQQHGRRAVLGKLLKRGR